LTLIVKKWLDWSSASIDAQISQGLILPSVLEASAENLNNIRYPLSSFKTNSQSTLTLAILRIACKSTSLNDIHYSSVVVLDL